MEFFIIIFFYHFPQNDSEYTMLWKSPETNDDDDDGFERNMLNIVM